MSDRRTIARNTVFNAAGRIWEALAGIGLTVYTIDRVGLEGFGLWSLVALFTGYAALFDFGVNSGFTKYIAEYAARDDRYGVNAVISTGTWFYVALGALMLAVGWPLIDLLLAGTLRLMALLNPGREVDLAPGGPWSEARVLLQGALIIIAANNALAPFGALQTGLQRMGLANAIGFAASLVKVAVTVVLLESGFGVRGLLYASGVVLAFTAALNILVAFRIYPGLRCTPGRMNRAIFDRMFSFGWRSQVARLANLINFQTDRLVVAVATGGNLDLVGVYRVGEDLATKMRQAPALLVSALIPAVSSLEARDDQGRLAILYRRSTKYVGALAVPAALYLLATTELWLSLYGPKDTLGSAGWVARLLIVGYVMNVLPGPGVSVALGKGEAGLPMWAGLISMVANVVLTVFLFWCFGFLGVAAGTSLALGLSTAWFFRAMRRLIGLAPTALLSEALLWPGIAALPGTALCVAVNFGLQGFTDRPANLIAAGLCFGVFGLSYGLCLRLTPFVDAYDVDFLRDTLRADRLPGFRYLTARARHVR